MKRARRGDLAIYRTESTHVDLTRGAIRSVEYVVAEVTSVTREGNTKRARGPWSRGPRDLIEGPPKHHVRQGQLITRAEAVVRAFGNMVGDPTESGHVQISDLDAVRTLVAPFLKIAAATPWPNGLGWDVGLPGYRVDVVVRGETVTVTANLGGEKVSVRGRALIDPTPEQVHEAARVLMVGGERV